MYNKRRHHSRHRYRCAGIGTGRRVCEEINDVGKRMNGMEKRPRDNVQDVWAMATGVSHTTKRACTCKRTHPRPFNSVNQQKQKTKEQQNKQKSGKEIPAPDGPSENMHVTTRTHTSLETNGRGDRYVSYMSDKRYKTETGFISTITRESTKASTDTKHQTKTERRNKNKWIHRRRRK